MRILISRTDSIGDVVLTLPVAGVLKQAFPDCTVVFLGREYTRAVVERCSYVDEFVAWPNCSLIVKPEGVRREKEGQEAGAVEENVRRGVAGVRLLRELRADVIIHVFPVKEICFAAKRAGIPVRIATAGRWYTWLTCNRLLRIPRKNSELHEAQLNLGLLKGLGIEKNFPIEEIAELYGIPGVRTGHNPSRQDNTRQRIILHPKSKGSAREWGLDNFSALVRLMPPERYEVIITGTKEEGALMADFLAEHRGRVTDMTGRLTLSELIDLIASADALVAASTGPLHIAAALGIRAVGLYAPMRPIFPKRWAPVGRNATYLVVEKDCERCRKTGDCECIRAIRAEEVMQAVISPLRR